MLESLVSKSQTSLVNEISIKQYESLKIHWNDSLKQ